MASDRTDIMAGTLALMVLRTLDGLGPQHGYGIARRIDERFYALGWQEKQFETAIKVDDQLFESPTHKVDCFKGRVALEL